MMGDTYGDVLPYDFDVSQYSTVNFKVAAVGTFGEFIVDFVCGGAEYKIPVTPTSEWQDISITINEIPLDVSKLTQIAIYGAQTNPGDKFYVTDFNISK
jgi:hypothetical protein